MQSGKYLKEKNIKMIGRDWLTSALVKYIEVYYSKAEGFIVRSINNSCCRDIDTCRDN